MYRGTCPFELYLSLKLSIIKGVVALSNTRVQSLASYNHGDNNGSVMLPQILGGIVVASSVFTVHES